MIGIVSKKESILYKASDIKLITPKSVEAAGIVPTSSTTAQLALGDALAIASMKFKKFSKIDFKKLHPGGSLGSQLRTVEDIMITGNLNKVDYPSNDISGDYVTLHFSSKPRFINGTAETLSDGSYYLFTNVSSTQNFIVIGNTALSNTLQINDSGNYPLYEQDSNGDIYKLTLSYVNKVEANEIFDSNTGKVNSLINSLITIDVLEEDAENFDLPDTEINDTKESAITPATTITSAITKKDVLSTSNISVLTELPVINEEGNIVLESDPYNEIVTNVKNSIIESQSKTILADTLGVSAELIDVDHLQEKNSSAANMIYQIQALTTILKSTDTGSSNSQDKLAQASTSIADLLVDIKTESPDVSGIVVDLADQNNLENSISNIIDRNVQNTNSSVSNESKNNIASIATSVVSTVKNISTESNDANVFKSMIQVSYAAGIIANTLEASGGDVEVSVSQVVEEASNNDVVNVESIFIPTRGERGVIALRDNSGGVITEDIIQDISSIEISNNNDTVENILGDGSGSSLTISDLEDPNGTIRPLVLNAICDILFGNCLLYTSDAADE